MKKIIKRKILWLVNTPSLASKKLDIHAESSGSWIAAAELPMRRRKDIDLAVGFLYPCKKIQKFTYKGGLYYMIPNKYSNLQIRNFNDLLWVVKDFQPDLIHVFGTEGPFGLIADKIDIPVVIRIQGILNISSKARVENISVLRTLIAMNLTDYLSVIRRFSLRTALKREKKIIKINKYYIGQTQWDEDFVSLLPGENQYFRVNSFVRGLFFENKWQHKAGTLKLISVISPRPNKGLGQVLQVAKILKQQGLDFKWTIMGVSNNNLVAKSIESSQKTRFSHNNVALRGLLGEKTLARSLVNSSIYVHPSHIENECTSIVEAMVLGMPIIANFVGGLPAIIENNKTGLFVPDNDCCAMAAQIIKLTKNPKSAQRLGQNARKLALERNNTQKTIETLVDVYDKVIKIFNEEKR